jgi:hypothetical protein
VRLERIARNQARAQFREPAFLFPWKMGVEIFRYDKLENSITQKFQALIVLVIALFFVAETGMGQRLLEQSWIQKLVAEALLERFHVNVFEKQPAR